MKSVKSVTAKSLLIKQKSSPAVGSTSKPPLSKKNVMNMIHNVTVASPPTSAGKERSASTSDIKQDAAKVSTHSRSRTRTIDPKESILHQQEILRKAALLAEPVQPVEPVKEPIAYELNFEEGKMPPRKVDTQEDDDYNYESDFESYESDFEAEVPSAMSEKSSVDSSNELEVNELQQDDKPNDETSRNDKERIDSGSYEMSMKKPVTPLSVHYDSIDDTINSHDSGISYDDLNVITSKQMSQKTQEFYRRGEELMKKITLDEMTFNIFESKPVPYDTFMALFGGQENTSQAGTQSESLAVADEVQTDVIMKAEAWTQFPTKFTMEGLQSINSKQYNEEKLGVGEGNFELEPQSNDDSEHFTQHIDAINNFSRTEDFTIGKSRSNVNSAELCKFVANAALTITNVLDNQSKLVELKPSRISISRGFTQLKFNEVDALHDTNVKKLYTNVKVSNFIVTVHKKAADQMNLLCLWDVLNTKRPLKIFSSWSDVKCLEIHDIQRDVIVGGCSDGTISLWDAQEFSEWRDEDEVTSIIKPCEIISLNQLSNDFSLDNVVALRSLPHRELKKASKMFTQSQASQICSLHRNGSIIIWTISRAFNEEAESLKKTSELDYTHLKSLIKLIKNVIIDLNSSSRKIGKENVKRKSAFEKTRYYFENDLFSDKVLRELQEIDTNRLTKVKNPLIDDELMKFNGCAVNLNEIFVASDLNFVLAISRLNLVDQTRKILTDESSFVAPTAIEMHTINTNVLAIGQANGEVKFIKVQDDENFNSGASSKLARKSTDSTNIDVLSKSCAFQNIVEKEKKLYDDTQALNNLESDELKAFLINEALSEQFFAHDSTKDKLKVSFDKNIFNSFEVSSGSVRSIAFNKSGEFMFVLIGKQLRIFNCWTNSEVDQQEKLKIWDVKCVQGADSSEYLVKFLLLSLTLRN